MTISRRTVLMGGAAFAGAFGAGLLGSRWAMAAPPTDVTATLTTYNWGNPDEARAYASAFERFRKTYPNVTVQDNIAPVSNWGDYADKLVTQIASGNPPDIINIAIEGVRLAVAKGLLLPLDDLIASDPDAKALLAAVPRQLIDGLSVDGKLYEFPNGWQTMVIHYNTKLFADAGVPAPDPNWTWEDFLATAQKLTKGDGSSKIYGYGLPWFNFAMHPWYLTNGTYPVTADYAHSNLNDPKMIEAAQFVSDLVHKHGVSPDPIGLNVYDQFAAGRFAMVGAGRWPVTGWVKAGFTDFDVVPWPRKATADTVFGCAGWGISPQSKNPELAWEVIKELVSKPTVTEVMSIGQQIPIYKEVAETPTFLKDPAHASLFFDVIDKSRPVAAPAYFNTLERITSSAMDRIITEDATAEEALNQAHEELEQEIARASKG
jgi:multiple sugar transport system substrate-binding protein